MLTDEEIEGVRNYAGVLYRRKNLRQYRVSLEEAEAIALALAVKYDAKYDGTTGTRQGYLLNRIEWEMSRRCAKEGRILQTLWRNYKTNRMSPTGFSSDPVDFASAFDGAVTEPEGPDLSDLVEWSVRQLPQKMWQRILVAVVAEGKSYRDIGAELGCSGERVRQVWNDVILPRLREAAKCWY